MPCISREPREETAVSVDIVFPLYENATKRMLLALERTQSMSPESEELKERICGLTDAQLLQIVTVEANAYRPEAVEFARAELAARRVDYSQPQAETAPALDLPSAVPAGPDSAR